MAQQKNNWMWIGLVIVAAFFLYSNPGLFTIYLQSEQVAYYNVPIEARFTLSNFSSPVITAYFNNVQVYTADDYTTQNITEPVTHTNLTDNSTYTINETHEVKTYPAQNQKYVYTYETSNGTYVLKLTNVTQTGIFKFVVSEGNHTESQIVEVRKAFVDMKNNLDSTVNQGDTKSFEIKTYTPQGEILVADNVEMDVTKPDNTQETITLTKNGNIFTANYNYKSDGNYIFKVRPRKDGFDTKEFTIVVSSIKSGGIPLIMWIWMGAIGIFLILLVVKLVRRR